MERFIITVARETGSGGHNVTRRLSEALGIPYYDRDLLRKASEVSGIHERRCGAADERIGLREMLSPDGVTKARKTALNHLRQRYPGSELHRWREVFRLVNRARQEPPGGGHGLPYPAWWSSKTTNDKIFRK